METTTNEQVVLKAIVEFAHKSSDTGVEYLLDEVVSETGMSQLSVQGVLSSLQKKGYIECFGDECYFDGMITENAENWYQEQQEQEQEDNNNQNEEENMETTNERNIETTYLTAVNWLNNSRILCNEICRIDEFFYDNCRFDIEEGTDIFQLFLTNCSLSDVEFLEKHFGLLFAYSPLLDLYVLCVDHYGTHWDSVPCYTDIEAAKKNN